MHHTNEFDTWKLYHESVRTKKVCGHKAYARKYVDKSTQARKDKLGRITQKKLVWKYKRERITVWNYKCKRISMKESSKNKHKKNKCKKNKCKKKKSAIEQTQKYKHKRISAKG